MEIVQDARREMNGIAKKIRYVMSTKTAKIELLGVNTVEPDFEHLVLQYHQAEDTMLVGRIFYVKNGPNLCWVEK